MREDTAHDEAVITLDRLCVTLGNRPILIDLSASLGGRAIGLLGPNGAGKTTLLRTLLGFFPASGGSASVLGNRLEDGVKPIRSLIGYMPENDAYLAQVTAVRFVRYMAELSGLPPDAALEQAHQALFYVGLGEARYRKIGTFSTGMKQMVKLAQAMVHGPRLLFLDEPTNGLDPPARKRMLELIAEIREQKETTIVLSSHLLHDVESTCDEVLILKAGRVAALCNLEQERRTNRSFVELELIGPGEAFLTRLGERGCESAQLPDNRIKLILPPTMEVRDLWAEAQASGISFRRLNHKRDSLQDIFLNAMEDHHASV